MILSKRPDKIRLGDVVRATEPDFALVECFTAGNECLITPRSWRQLLMGRTRHPIGLSERSG